MVEKRKYVKGGKTHRHVVTFTAEEDSQLQAKAEQVGVTVSRFLADTALGTTPVVKNRVAVAEMFGMRRQVQGIAGNLNQLVMDFNGGTTFETDLRAAVMESRAFVAEAREWMDRN